MRRAASEESKLTAPPTAFGFRGLEVYKVDNGTSRLRCVDLNGDSLTDIAIVNNSRATIDFFIQKTPAEIESSTNALVEYDNINEIASDARFRKESFLTEKRVFDLLVDDLNGDGRPDLAYYGDPKELVLVFRGPPGGTDVRQTFPISEARAFGRGLGAGDLNRDGKTDLVLLGVGVTHLFLQGADGKLAEPVEIPNSEKNFSGLAVADFDGDGRKDLLLVGAGSVEPIRVRFQGEAGLGPEIALETPAFRFLLVTDLTGDGRSEVIVVQGATGRLVVFQIEATPPERSVPLGRIRLFPLAASDDAARPAIALGDVDEDQLTDILETSPATAQLRLYRQGKDGSLLAPLTFPSLAGSTGTRIGDIDGDGKPEVVLLSVEEKSIGLSRWDGSRLTFPRSLPLGSKPVACALADLDGTAGLEVAIASEEDGAVSIEFFKAAEPLAPFGETLKLEDAKDAPDRIWFFDANQDSRVDLLASFPYESMRIYLQSPAEASGGSRFSDVSREKDFGRGLLQGAVAGSFGSGDLDGDGKPEFFLSKKNFARAFRVAPRMALEVVEQFNARDPAAEIIGVASADFDGDGRAEIALLDKARNLILLLARSEMGTYAVINEMKVPAFRYRGLVATDLNGDGRSDLFLEGEDRFGILHAGGSDYKLTRVAEYEADLKDVWLDQVAAGDMNSDGRLDVIVSELRSHLLEILTHESANTTLTRAVRFKVFEDGSRGGDFEERKNTREPREVAIADVTGDGKADVVLLIHDRILVYPQE